ncbi:MULTISPECIES: response regulator transcription factor [unclassified Cupriavidus]|uniref:response regulator transcription factor n=1 Tax=unclassified Cupriavidus TaxID=2640874 RepID=UPI0010F85E92|nr:MULTISPECIES: response regulator transcription factor [unclassified Cupriavidus]MWL86293.1 response regulator [Cupriavidus sp. SW-Y-13]
MPNALVIDTHPAIRRNAQAVLQGEGFDEVRFASGGIEALDTLRARAADFVMLDLQMADLPGDAVLEEVVANYPLTRVLVLSALQQAAERALLSGAHGYVDKGGGLENLGDTVRAVMSGYASFPLSSLPTIRRAAINPADPRALLSRRELTVLRFLAVGHSNKAISDALGISNKTVSSHKTSIMTKLGFNSLIDLAEFSRRHQLAF